MGSGESRLKLQLETLDGAGNKQITLSLAFEKLEICDSATQSRAVSCFTTNWKKLQIF